MRKAHLNGVLGEDEFVYVELPEGYEKEGECARLSRWLCGMRPAAQDWEVSYSQNLDLWVS